MLASADCDQENIESGDRVTLVDRNGRQSPVLVKILRAVTPRTFSARLAGQQSRWQKQHSITVVGGGSAGDGDKQSPPRIFEIVRCEDLGPPGGPHQQKVQCRRSSSQPLHFFWTSKMDHDG